MRTWSARLVGAALGGALLGGCWGGTRTQPVNPPEAVPHWIPASPLPSLELERPAPPAAPAPTPPAAPTPLGEEAEPSGGLGSGPEAPQERTPNP